MTSVPGPPRAVATEHDGVTWSLSATVLESADAAGLADFYRRLLGWVTVFEEPGWVMLRPPGGGTGLSFQEESAYQRPTWPATAGEPQMQLHLDVLVDDLPAAVERAVAVGAQVAAFQPQDHCRVMLDPAGHPFCLFAG